MSIDYLILIKLVFAHFLVDFCFQPKSLVEHKKEGKQFYHVFHALLHAVIAYLIVGCWAAWYIPVALGVSHYLIDYGKSCMKESLRNFILDQVLHMMVLIVLWLCITRQFAPWWDAVEAIFTNTAFWVYLTGFVFILKPTSIILAISTKKWEEGRGENGLEDAGQWIGYLERILILVFMCLSVYEAIGFILAAKSIFRFGELKDAGDIRKTEYIMIGTLLSFTIAIVVGIVINYLTSTGGDPVLIW